MVDRKGDTDSVQAGASLGRGSLCERHDCFVGFTRQVDCALSRHPENCGTCLP